jgi:arylsulfatase A-like enzyme
LAFVRRQLVSPYRAMKTSLPLLALIAAGFVSSPTAAADRPNVLFIAIDDLNHWVGHLGRNRQTKTPNIDRLAARGVTFTRAYCTAPACNSSRASLMSGQRPSTTGCYVNAQNWRPGIAEDKLLNSHFAKAGYQTFGAGKIYHGSYGRGGHWDDYFVPLLAASSATRKAQRHPDAQNNGVGGIQFYPLAGEDEDMPDYRVVSYGIEQLQKGHDRPFFLAIGLVKPHMPFAVPKKLLDKLPHDSIELPPHQADDLDDVPPAGVRMAGPNGDHAAILKSGRWKEAVQAYLATIAFADAQVGRLLDAFDQSPYRDNTIVVLWSDHGWSLGEKSHWRKFALWEEPTRSVFIWSVPGVTNQAASLPARSISRQFIQRSALWRVCRRRRTWRAATLRRCLKIQLPPGTYRQSPRTAAATTRCAASIGDTSATPPATRSSTTPPPIRSNTPTSRPT